MTRWIAIADMHDLPVGSVREVVVEDRVCAVANVSGEIHVLDGICPHQGGPLGKGACEGAILTCPWHGWQFDVRDGQCQLTPTVRQPRVTARVENQQVMIDFDALTSEDRSAEAEDFER